MFRRKADQLGWESDGSKPAQRAPARAAVHRDRIALRPGHGRDCRQAGKRQVHPGDDNLGEDQEPAVQSGGRTFTTFSTAGRLNNAPAVRSSPNDDSVALVRKRRGAFGPRPSCDAPSIGRLAERRRKDRPGLCNLLPVYFEHHVRIPFKPDATPLHPQGCSRHAERRCNFRLRFYISNTERSAVC